MSLVLNTNIAAMNATRNLATTQNQQATTFERLSTGLRVNSAKDDAAGLYLAQSQTKDIRGLNMATRNANDGISMAQTAEGALDQIGQNLQRINELAIQSANGTYNDAAREGLQKEVDQLTQEINRIYDTTEFNGQPLLNKDALSTVMQIGFKNDNNARIEAGLPGGIAGLPGLENKTFFGADRDFQNITVDGDSKTTSQNVQEAWAASIGIDSFDAGSTPALENAAVGADMGSAIANALADFQGDADTLGEALRADTNVANATDATISFTADGVDYTLKFQLDGDDQLTSSELTGNSGGTEFVIASDDLQGAGVDATSATFSTSITGSSVGSVNDYGAGTVTVPGDIAVKVSDSNALNAIVSDGLNQTKSVDISTQEAAQNAITATRTAIDQVSEIRATFGAVMNRFEAVISGNQIYSENLSAARSRIQDADFAVETSNLAKQQVLQQAGISSLSQANASSQAILGLLG